MRERLKDMFRGAKDILFGREAQTPKELGHTLESFRSEAASLVPHLKEQLREKTIFEFYRSADTSIPHSTELSASELDENSAARMRAESAIHQCIQSFVEKTTAYIRHERIQWMRVKDEYSALQKEFLTQKVPELPRLLERFVQKINEIQ